MNIVLVGAGSMAEEYIKVLHAIKSEFKLIGRGEANIRRLQENYAGLTCFSGGVEQYLEANPAPTHAIVAVSVQDLFKTTEHLLFAGVKSILVEKPVALGINELKRLIELKNKHQSFVVVAYNRRFYKSTERAREYIREDGGIVSCHFEFTEWSHKIATEKFSQNCLENWLVANSSHVIDLAFHFCGSPRILHSTITGKGIDWHPSGSVFVGAGITNKDIPYSYHSNWEAPGRWSLELLTKGHRLYFRPMERLRIQRKGSIAVENDNADYTIDETYKPGLFRQVNSFIKKEEIEKMCLLEQHLEHLSYYKRIAGYQP